jgi:hypothetical protein
MFSSKSGFTPDFFQKAFPYSGDIPILQHRYLTRAVSGWEEGRSSAYNISSGCRGARSGWRGGHVIACDGGYQPGRDRGFAASMGKFGK